MAEDTAKRDYVKLKCVFCGLEMASRAKAPKCSNCGSRRFNVIAEFSATKPFKKVKECDSMTKKEQEAQVKKKPAQDAEEQEDTDDTEEQDDDIEDAGGSVDDDLGI